MTKSAPINFWGKEEKLDITIDGVTIPQVSHTKFLGVHIDEDLTWNHHISQLYSKILANQHLLRISKNILDVDS